ncbi:MAG: Tetratricopeptide 2 repeat protein [Phycisphaerales bacterium]|nr:Tetratricopeptide 2 repeat protein [Phycisphaerales bacterium]
MTRVVCYVNVKPILRILLGLLVVLAGEARLSGAPAPATRPAAPATKPAPTPEEQKRLAAQQLTRRSVDLLRQKKYALAEAILVEALVIDPDHATNIYNMACLKALTDRPTDAIAYLERAANAGFTDFIHIEQDPDLNSLRQLPRYKALIANKDLYQKKDADRAVASLRRQLGDKYLFDVDYNTKLIFAADIDAQSLAAVKKWLTMQAKSQWEQLFSHKPDQYVAIVLPSAADYHKIITRIIDKRGVEGIYIHSARMLIAGRLGQVMTHEFTHALHAGDLDPLGQEHPIWIVEGLASLFESGQFEGEKLVPRDNYRLWHLRIAYRTGKLIPLERLFTWKQAQFVAQANLGYGEASSVMLYLYEHDLLRKFYDTYKTNFEKDPTGRLTLEQVTGMPLKEFEKAWQTWMYQRTPPATDIAVLGPTIGMYFVQENDGLKVDRIVGKGPADTAGVKMGDVVVGLNDLDVRDPNSLTPLLKEFKAGDSVMFKIRRGEEYVTLPLTLGAGETKVPRNRK